MSSTVNSIFSTTDQTLSSYYSKLLVIFFTFTIFLCRYRTLPQDFKSMVNSLILDLLQQSCAAAAFLSISKQQFNPNQHLKCFFCAQISSQEFLRNHHIKTMVLFNYLVDLVCLTSILLWAVIAVSYSYSHQRSHILTSFAKHFY